MNYILKDGVPVLESNLLTWAKWFEGGDDKRRVAFTEIGGVKVSTVFLGIDHSFGGGAPVLFETMIFGGEHDKYQERYCTLEEAMIGHEKAVSLVKDAAASDARAAARGADGRGGRDTKATD
jgi:hypothetical protein